MTDSPNDPGTESEPLSPIKRDVADGWTTYFRSGTWDGFPSSAA